MKAPPQCSDIASGCSAPCSMVDTPTSSCFADVTEFTKLFSVCPSPSCSGRQLMSTSVDKFSGGMMFLLLAFASVGERYVVNRERVELSF